MSRERLPATRPGIVHKFVIRAPEGRVKCFLIVGFYEDGRPGEIFLVIKNAGPTVQGFSRAWATSISVNFQSGVTLSDIVAKFAHWRFEPAGFVEPNDSGIRTAKSICDYVARFLAFKFLGGGDRGSLEIPGESAHSDQQTISGTAPPPFTSSP